MKGLRLCWVMLLGLGVLQLAAIASAALVEFNKELMAAVKLGHGAPMHYARSYRAKHLQAANDQVSYAALMEDVLAPNSAPDPAMLCKVGGAGGDGIKNTTNSDQVKVVIAVSTCLTPKMKTSVASWVQAMQDANSMYFKAGETHQITYETAVVPGECQSSNESAVRVMNDQQKQVFNLNPPSSRNKLQAESSPRDELVAKQRNLEAREVSEADLAEFSMFESIGPVLAGLPPAWSPPNVSQTATATQPVMGVISFVTDATSYQTVSQYQRSMELDGQFTFHTCAYTQTSCSPIPLADCIDLDDEIDLFMFSPFTVVRSFECSAVLKDGVPVTYVNAGVRECYCTCPAGTKKKPGVEGSLSHCDVDNEPCVCEWNGHTYKHNVVSPIAIDQCTFTHVKDYGVDTPFPSDNFVASLRKNAGDPGNLASSPRVEVTTSAGYKHTYTWSDYQSNADAAINAITFPGYGKYSMAMTAYDYDEAHPVSCPGCLAFADTFRPHATHSCPTSQCDGLMGAGSCSGDPVSMLTDAKASVANAEVQAFYDFQQKDVQNDACSLPRCDIERYQKMDFFETVYTTLPYADGKTCFDPATLEANFLAATKAKTNPLVTHDASGNVVVVQTPPVASPNMCTRCCAYYTQLKENWINFDCTNSYEQVCSEGGESCQFSQCLGMYGDSLATVAARIKPSVVSASQAVIGKLEPQGYQTTTQIHIALKCTDFKNAGCSYTAKISDLIETQARLNLQYMKGADVTEYVFWRYRIDTGLWKSFDASQVAETFAASGTKIIIEAWSACGRVREFRFELVLHLSVDIKVCEKFTEMWYQSTVAPPKIKKTYCTFPGSDFAEMTFDYHPNIGVPHSLATMNVDIDQVSCTVLADGRGTPAPLFTVNAAHPEIVKRFGIQLVNSLTTKASTSVAVECTFVYTQFDNTTLSQTCSDAFTIQDCDLPGFDCPEGACDFSPCSSNPAKVLPFQICDGVVVSTTQSTTQVTTVRQDCCQSCQTTPVTCSSIFGPGVDEIKVCTPNFDGGAVPSLLLEVEDEGSLSPSAASEDDSKEVPNPIGNGDHNEDSDVEETPTMLALRTDEETEASNKASTQSIVLQASPSLIKKSPTILLAASALIAVVAMVAMVVVRRHAVTKSSTIEEDAYVALLE